MNKFYVRYLVWRACSLLLAVSNQDFRKITLICGGNLVIISCLVCMHVIYAAHGWFFQKSFVSFASHFFFNLFRGHQRRKTPTFLSCFLAVYISTIGSLIISLVVEIRLGYETLFRGFRLGFVVWSLLPFSDAGSDFRRLRCVPCLRCNWAAKVDQSLYVTMPHKLVFGRSNEVSLTRGIVGIGVPRIVWLDMALSYLAVPLGSHATRVET